MDGCACREMWDTFRTRARDAKPYELTWELQVLDRPAVAYKGNAKVWWKFAIESARSDALSR